MKSVLHDKHLALGGVMTKYSGGDFPLHYKDGVANEHAMCRSHVGILDVSYMRVIEITGDGAEALLDYLSTNTIFNTPNLSATYTIWCHEWGGCIDDVTIYRCDCNTFYIIVNEVNLSKNLEHIKREGRFFDVEFRDRSDDLHVLAIQGKFFKEVVHKLLPGCTFPKPMQFIKAPFQAGEICMLQTGYGGPVGIEMIVPKRNTVALWDSLMNLGEEYGIIPLGLQAREIFRMEAGYPRYGSELTEDVAPTETMAAWTVKWMKGDYIGKEALLRLENDTQKRSQHGLVFSSGDPLPNGSFVYKRGSIIGKVTSGVFSYCLQKPIALAMVEGKLAIGEKVEVENGGKRCKADVVQLPFYRI